MLAELAATEATKMAGVAAAQLHYVRLAARLRTMQASADQRARLTAKIQNTLLNRTTNMSNALNNPTTTL